MRTIASSATRSIGRSSRAAARAGGTRLEGRWSILGRRPPTVGKASVTDPRPLAELPNRDRIEDRKSIRDSRSLSRASAKPMISDEVSLRLFQDMRRSWAGSPLRSIESRTSAHRVRSADGPDPDYRAGRQRQSGRPPPRMWRGREGRSQRTGPASTRRPCFMLARFAIDEFRSLKVSWCRDRHGGPATTRTMHHVRDRTGCAP